MNIIFIKTKKVGGTSFEIALSKFCDANDIVTPISPDDEVTRRTLGYQGPINYDAHDRRKELTSLGISGNFRNHTSSKEIRENLGAEIYHNAVKITIHRDPLDFLISQYYYSVRNKSRFLRPSFKRWLAKNYNNVRQNYQIAPLEGALKPDVVLRYATLQSDILEANVLPADFLERFKSLSAKRNLRPQHTRVPEQFFEAEGCEAYIRKVNDVIRSI